MGMADKTWLSRPPRPSLFDPLTGLVTLVNEAQAERSDPDVFVVAAQTADTAVYGFPTTADTKGSGAGLTAQAAWGATIGESIERYACCIVHPEDLIHGSYADLQSQGYALSSPDQWALYDPALYEQMSYARFTPHTKIAWTRAESLTHRTERWVPAALVYMASDAAFREHDGQILGPAISTGAACAASRAEALLKGICEVLERDAFIIMWRNRLSCPRVRIDAASSIHRLFQEKFARPGLEYNLIYTTLDLSIPSFFGFLRDTRRNPPGIVVGGAAHPDPSVAARKTLLELVQGLKWMDYIGHRSFPVVPGFRNIRSFEDRSSLYAFNDLSEAFNFLLESPNEISLSSIASLELGDVHDNLHQCYRLLNEQGLEALALDLTPVDVLECGLHVTKVVIPECQPLEADHLLQFLGGRRWREVPARLGLLSAPPTYASVNLWPHPYP